MSDVYGRAQAVWAAVVASANSVSSYQSLIVQSPKLSRRLPYLTLQSKARRQPGGGQPLTA